MALNNPAYWVDRLGASQNFALFAAKLGTWVTQLKAGLAEMVADLLPVALPVLGIALAVFFGVKFIKKVMR